MSEEWRRIQAFRGVSRLRVTVSADAEIQIRSGETVYPTRFLSANSTLDLRPLPPNCSIWLKSDDPNCQCRVQAEYTEAATDVLRDIILFSPIGTPITDMRLLYGPMGLGIPMTVTGNPFDYQITPYDVVREQMIAERARVREEERLKEQLKEKKPSQGITRLQAFMRELEEEKPKKKEVRKKWWRKPSL